MKRTLVFLFAVVCFSASANAQTANVYEYQGNIPGITTFQEFASHINSEDSEALNAYYCGQSVNGLRSCKLSSNLVTHFWFVDDKLASIRINFNSASHLDDFVAGLSKKFGRSKKTIVSYQNGFGATRSSRVWTWQSLSGGIQLSEIGVNQDFETGELAFYDTKLRNTFLDRFDPKPKL